MSTIIPRVHVGYEMVDSQQVHGTELVIIISYPTRESGLFYCFIKNSHKISRILPNFICKNNQFSACFFYFEQMRTVTIFGEHGRMAHIQ